MDRRNIFKTALAAAFGLVAARGARAEIRGAQKAVYHLADTEKVAFVLGNLRNHLDGGGGIALATVVHGPALAAFKRSNANRAVIEDAEARMKAGVAFYACIHTMEAMKLTLEDLPPGFAVAEKGGVVMLADLQAQGWAYLRP
jgi:intracellular sulfur oxidation DsrE/DsrF family protein